MARLKVGDKVVIVECTAEDDSDAYVGRVGIIEEDDETNRPYWVKFEGCHAWCREAQVRLVTSSPTPGKPVTAFEVGKWYTWFGMNNGKPTECINLRNGGRSGDFLDKDDGHKIGIGLPDNSIREVPAPSQGHMHTMPRTSSPYSDDVVCGEPRTGKHTVSIYPNRIQSVDVRTRTATFKMARPVATRSKIRRRLLNLE